MYKLFDDDEKKKPIEQPKKESKLISYTLNFIIIVLAIVAGLYIYDYSHMLLK